MLIAGLFLAGCGSTTDNGTDPTRPAAARKSLHSLTPAELKTCDSVGFDSDIALSIRMATDSTLLPFPSDLLEIPTRDSVAYARCAKLPGLIVYTESDDDSKFMVHKLAADLKRHGYTIFAYDNQNPKPLHTSSCVGILATVDQYDVLRRVQTDGINYNIDNDSLIRMIHTFDDHYVLELVGAGGDWCEFTIRKAHPDWTLLSQQAYKVCPDIVDQGTSTVEVLATEMKKSRSLYFWWD